MTGRTTAPAPAAPSEPATLPAPAAPSEPVTPPGAPAPRSALAGPLAPPASVAPGSGAQPRRLRIGVASQWYEPEGGSVAVVGAICRALAAAGHEVHVLTGFPNYPTGALHPGYRIRRYAYERRGDVHVHRVPLLPSHDRSAVRRAATYLSFAGAAAAQSTLLREMDVWLVHSSPATAALPAVVAQWRYRRPYVLLVQDLWPETVLASRFLPAGPLAGRVAGAAVRGLRSCCDLAYRRASAVAVTSPGMAPVLRARGVGPDRLSWVPNWVDEHVFRPVAPDPAVADQLGLAPAGDCPDEPFTVMYAGNLGDLQGLETVVTAVRMLADLPGLRMVFVGDGVAAPRLRALAADLPSVRFVGPQPTGWMPDLLALGDVQLVSLRDLPLFHTTLPSKLQATLAAGRPVVAAVPGDAARLVTDAGAGLAVPPEDPTALAAALRRMHAMGRQRREQWGAAGRRYYQRRLSAAHGAGALQELLHRAVRDAAGPVATTTERVTR